MQTINPQALKAELKDAVMAGYPAMIWVGQASVNLTYQLK